jgi:hypothetical protein
MFDSIVAARKFGKAQKRFRAGLHEEAIALLELAAERLKRAGDSPSQLGLSMSIALFAVSAGFSSKHKGDIIKIARWARDAYVEFSIKYPEIKRHSATSAAASQISDRLISLDGGAVQK